MVTKFSYEKEDQSPWKVPKIYTNIWTFFSPTTSDISRIGGMWFLSLSPNQSSQNSHLWSSRTFWVNSHHQSYRLMDHILWTWNVTWTIAVTNKCVLERKEDVRKGDNRKKKERGKEGNIAACLNWLTTVKHTFCKYCVIMCLVSNLIQYKRCI